MSKPRISKGRITGQYVCYDPPLNSSTNKAAGVVAEVLGIPCTMTYPKGFKIRGFTGEDVSLPKEQLEGDIMGFVRRLREEVNGD